LFPILIASLLAQAQPVPPAAPITLEMAEKMALERNPDVQKATLQTLSAEQDKVIARAAILPSLVFNASLSETRQGETAGTDTQVVGGVLVPGTKHPTTVFTNWATSANIEQLIFDGGKWWNNMDAADLGLQSSQALLAEQKLQIGYLVEQRFYELVRAQRQLKVLSDAAARSRDQADFTQRLFEGGRATQADVYAARANRDNDEIQRLGAERTIELNRSDLALAIGLDPGEPLTVAEPSHMMDEPAQPPPAKDAVARALDARPSIKAASLLLESSRKSASAAGGDYWPRVFLRGGYSKNTAAISDQFEDPRKNSTLAGSINLSWNIFNGFSTSAGARKAEITALLNENDLRNARRNVASDVEKAVAQLSTARAQNRVAQQAEQTAKEGLRLAKTRQEVGVGTQLEVRDAELKLTQAQLSVVGSLVDGREAEAALKRAQGGT
jgi:outer membrane protein